MKKFTKMKTTMHVVLDTPDERDAFMRFCKRTHIYCEPSGYGSKYYMNLEINEEQAKACNRFLATL